MRRFTAAGVTTVGWFYGLLVLPESLPPDRRTKTPWRRANPVGALGILVRDRGLLGLASVGFLAQLSAQAVNIIFVLYTAHRYHWGSAEVGLLLTAFAAGNILAMAVISPRLVKAIGEPSTLLIGLALAAVGFVGLGLAPSGLLFCLACCPTGMANVFGPALQALQSRRVGPSDQGRLQGALASVAALTGLVGPIFFTQVFAWSISPGFAIDMSGVPLLVAAALMAAAVPGALMALRWGRPQVRRDETGDDFAAQ